MSVRRAFWLCSYTGKTYILLELHYGCSDKFYILSFMCWFTVSTTMKGFPLWKATSGRCNLGCGYSSSQRLWMHNITLKSVGRSVSSRSNLWLYWAASRGESEIKCPKSNTRYSSLPIKLWQKC